MKLIRDSSASLCCTPTHSCAVVYPSAVSFAFCTALDCLVSPTVFAAPSFAFLAIVDTRSSRIFERSSTLSHAWLAARPTSRNQISDR